MIPLATTTVSVFRTPSGDPYIPSQAKKVTSLRGHISSPSGTDLHVGGEQQIIDAVLLTEIGCDVQHTDRITDGCETYDVVWVTERHGLGLDHLKAGLVLVEGAANG